MKRLKQMRLTTQYILLGSVLSIVVWLIAINSTVIESEEVFYGLFVIIWYVVGIIFLFYAKGQSRDKVLIKSTLWSVFIAFVLHRITFPLTEFFEITMPFVIYFLGSFIVIRKRMGQKYLNEKHTEKSSPNTEETTLSGIDIAKAILIGLVIVFIIFLVMAGLTFQRFG